MSQLLNIGSGICFLYAILTLVILFDPQWQRENVAGNVRENRMETIGLWQRCHYLSSGNRDCDYFDNLLICVPGYWVAARVFAIFATISGFLALGMSFAGLSCVNCVNDPNTKTKISRIAAILFAFSAICLGIGVTWFSAVVYREFSVGRMGYNMGSGGLAFGNPQCAVTQAEYHLSQGGVFGRDAWIGWLNTVLGIIGSVLMFCGSSATEDDDMYNDGTMNNNGYNYGKPSAGEYL